MECCGLSSVLLVLAFVLIKISNAELFSSLGQMRDLINDEIDLVTSLNEYIQSEDNRLQKIKETAAAFEKISNHAKSDVDGYLSHPVNQFRLVKRLASEWQNIETLIDSGSNDEFIRNYEAKQGKFPGPEDVKGSAQAIIRLQDTYKLDTHLLAEGDIKGIKANQSLTSEDCYEIGRMAYLEKDYYHCKLWMTEVLSMNEGSYTFFTKFDVLDHLAFSIAQLGNIRKAFQLTTQMLRINSEDTRIQGNYWYYKGLLEGNKKGDEEDMDDVIPYERKPKYSEFESYEKLCRGTFAKVPKKVQKSLKCYYHTNNDHPRLVLSPVKLEELWPSPHLVRFYDVVSDTETQRIQMLAKPKLNRATVQNPLTGNLEHADYRVSKSAWLKNHEDEVVARICQRISDITGLTMSTAEELQIANYGIGGQYEPHYDYARTSDVGRFDQDIGNRIATFLFYFTDVQLGGSTVFLNPGIGVQPIKGSAVFWYNLLPNGEGDWRTRHAACPVLTGIKWVGNKWIHERGQEFRRKCGLDQNADNRFF